MSERRTSILSRLCLLVSIVVVGLGISAYAMGWLTFERTEDAASVELKTGEIKDAANSVSATGEELIDSAGETLKDFGDSLTDDNALPQMRRNLRTKQ